MIGVGPTRLTSFARAGDSLVPFECACTYLNEEAAGWQASGYASRVTLEACGPCDVKAYVLAVMPCAVACCACCGGNFHHCGWVASAAALSCSASINC
jgi:hypothetical protein